MPQMFESEILKYVVPFKILVKNSKKKFKTALNDDISLIWQLSLHPLSRSQ